MEVNKIFSDITVKSSDDGQIKIAGWASTSSIDRHGDVILPKAWRGGIKSYKANPVLLYNHNHSKVIGKATNVSVDDEKGLYIEAEIDDRWENAYQIEKGYLKTFSVGFRIPKGGAEWEDDKFVIKKAELLEVSIVTIPANPSAIFSQKTLEIKNELIMLEKIKNILGLSSDASEDDITQKVNELKELGKFAELVEISEDGISIKGLKEVSDSVSSLEKSIEDIDSKFEASMQKSIEDLNYLIEEQGKTIDAQKEKIKDYEDKVTDLIKKYGAIQNRKTTGEPNDIDPPAVQQFKKNIRKFKVTAEI